MKQIRRIPGQSAVEFALVIPLILLLFLIFIDLGRIVYFHSALYNAVREGTRYATVTQYDGAWENNIKDKVVDYSIAMPLNKDYVSASIFCIDQNDIKSYPPCIDPTKSYTKYVTVSARAEIDPMAIFLAQMLGNGNKFNIKAESTMQMTPYGAYSE